MSFGTLVDGFIDYLGEDADGDRAQYELITNLALQALSEEHAWDCLRRRGIIKLLAPKTDNGMIVVQDSNILEASATTFTRDHVGAEFKPSDDNGRVYEIIEYTDSTHVLLNYPYQGASGTDTTYTIRKRTYVLPMDVAHFHIGRLRERNSLVLGASDFQPDLTDPNSDTSGEPGINTIDGYTVRPMFAGTGVFTNGSADVTGVTGADATFVGRSLRKEGDMRTYIVRSVSGTTVTLDEVYRGTGAVGAATLEVSPAGSPEFAYDFGMPDSDMLHEYRYTRQHPWMVEQVEYPLFPTRMYPLIYALGKWQLVLEQDHDAATVQMHHNLYKHYFKRFVGRQRTIAPRLAVNSQLKIRQRADGVGGLRPQSNGVRWGR